MLGYRTRTSATYVGKTLVLLLSIGGVLSANSSAKELEAIDALSGFTTSKGLSASRFGSAELRSFRGHFDEQMNLPTFLSASPGTLQGSPLLLSQDAAQVARGHLKSLGSTYRIADAEVDALAVANIQRLPNGAALVQFDQSVDSIPVFRERVSVLVNVDGTLNSIGGYVSGVGGLHSTSTKALFRKSEADAIATALGDFNFATVEVRSGLQASDARDGYAFFALAAQGDNGERLVQPARIHPVFFRLPTGLVPAWYIEVEVVGADNDDSYYSYVVSAKDSSLLYRHNLTQRDSFTYRVWANPTPLPGPSGRNGIPYPTATPNGYQAPFVTPQKMTLLNAMPATSIAAADPWLPNGATQTLGNNVDAYVDLVAPDGFTPASADFRATTTSPGMFDRIYDVTQTPQANQTQQMAAITQLFYVTNWLHDWYYDDGFDEASGNAQDNNYGRGGAANDRLLAEAQDYSGFDNANMSTPADGGSPRMQMYLFNGTRAEQLNTSGALTDQMATASADFNPSPTINVSGTVVYVSDATAPVHDGCQALLGTAPPNALALIDRGMCSYKSKVKRAQDAGYIGAVIVQSTSGPPQIMGEDFTVSGVTIPSMMISLNDGAAIKLAILSGTVTAQMQAVVGITRDGSLDTTVVAHEWGHYISNRLVHNGAGLGTNQSGGMGEGFGDFHAMLLMVGNTDTPFNGTYGIGGYDSGGPSLSFDVNNGYYYGLRRYPYTIDLAKNPLTFKYITSGVPLPATPVAAAFPASFDNSEVHNTGEVWASALWECYAAMLRHTPAQRSFNQIQDRMKRYLIGGYKMMPVSPTFTEARDSILAVISSQDATDFADCSGGFAKRGLGVGAVAPDRFSLTNDGVVESFSTSAAITWNPSSLNDTALTCDSDGTLDGLETGTLSLSLRNTGFETLTGTTVTVSSPDAFVTLPQPVVTLPATTIPYATRTMQVPVKLTSLIGTRLMTLNYSASDPTLGASTVNGQAQFRVNADVAPSKIEDFESPTLLWTPVLQTLTDPALKWQRLEIDPTHHVAYAPDAGAVGLSMLVSPSMQVSSTGNFVVTFTQNFGFELSDAAYDGGVIEISQDNGATWADVTAAGGTLTPAYGGTIVTLDVNANPYAGRDAYIGASDPGLTPATIDFGTALQGKTVKIRFVIATDSAQGDVGWMIDDFAASGIVNLPFAHLVADPGHCLAGDRIYANGFDAAL
jgi:large repetitive protein